MNNRKSLIVILGVLSLGAWSTVAQEVSAGITGRVTDPSGLAIAGATVTARDTQRGTNWPTTTNEDGIYAFPRVPIGTYELKVEAKGFKTSIQSAFTLEVNQRARIDIAMQVGGITETVTVTGEGAMLQTDTTQVGAVISSQTIVNTPLISRNPIALTLLAAGVVATDPSSFNSGVRTAGGGRPYVNGNRKEANNFLLDGVDNNQTSDNLSSYQPNLEAIAEFKLITNNASAEFGNFQGGIVNVIIKSGTNQLHGSAFEYFRNDKMNANNWGRNWQGTPRTAIRWNQYGGTIGGPIFKDKMFFFADFQGLRKATPPSVSATTVIPEPWRKGDLSNLLDPAYVGASAGIQLYDPNSVNTTTGVRAPYTNNQIPVSSFNSVIKNLFANTSLYPLPALTTATIATPNYFYSSSSYVKSDQGDFKLDWKLSSKDDFSGRYSNGRQDQPGVNTAPYLYNSFNIAPFQNGVINWTRTISPTLVNEARFGVNNILLNNGGEDKGLGDVASKLGIQSAGSGLLSLQGFTYISSLGNANIGTQQLFANTTYHFADNVTIIKGRHMMKAGMQALRQQMNTFYAGNNGRNGYISFSGRFTAANAINPSGKLVPEADFLLGMPTDLGRGLSTGTWGHRKTIWAAYFQDDWRATDKLTLNLGLRWEYHTPLVEVKDRQSNISPFTGQLQMAGQDGNSRALYNPFKKDFQPRVGFAYQAMNKLVARGAYTISSFMEGTGTNLRLPLNPPFNSEFQALYNTPAYLLPGTTLDQGLSGLNPKDPFDKATLRIWDPNVRPAITQQWNLTLEHQLPKNAVLTVAYVGQHGTHLVVPMPYLQKRIVNGAVGTSDYLAGNPTLRAKISQISGTETNGNQQYHALQTTARKRYSAGMEFQLSYTWSHGMSDSIGYYGEGGQAGSQSAYMQNLYDRRSEWGPTYFDAKHNFTGSFVYELPFGAKRKFGSSWNGVMNNVLGGWQLGGILTLQSGFPLTIKVSGDPSGTGARSFRANVIGTPNDLHQIGPGAKYLDVSAYSVPTAFTFGNAGIGIVRGPGQARFDMSLGKVFNITERQKFELRGEAFNLTNTPIFASPASQVITATTFGEIRSAQGERNIQISLKYSF
ncbi:TonB-dependent receptor [uncultured Paludibaculum sp.]|uniref:TonB-dependent receptor n=1 Tax=uncultured Paludibaculum sp. TaxID=1765020 RepID=UPI002AAB6BEE|nr:TonB-dependent receptor [uncultured Paludibaculum sp.]